MSFRARAMLHLALGLVLVCSLTISSSSWARGPGGGAPGRPGGGFHGGGGPRGGGGLQGGAVSRPIGGFRGDGGPRIGGGGYIHGGGGWHGGFRHRFGGPRVGLYLGSGFGPWGWGYPGPYYGYYGSPYGYSYALAEPMMPPTYIERGDPTQYWYYCQAGNGYYPTVQRCPGGWRAVAPQPPR